MASRRTFLLTAATLVASTLAFQVPDTPVAAGSHTMKVVSPVVGGIGIDAIYSGGSGGPQYDVPPCAIDGPQLNWDSAGNLVGTNWVPNSKPGLGSIVKVRFEMYPGECGHYTPWANVGGVHFETSPWNSNLGEIRLPALGQPGAFRIDGDIISSTPITEGRVHVNAFQIATGWPDPAAPLQTNGHVDYGAFGSGGSKGARWTGGVGWTGWYILFIDDKVTGRGITAFAPMSAGNVPAIDLDAVCFGFERCTHNHRGTPPPVRGDFHPTTPTRILDTRTGLGITDGKIRAGDGRNSDPNPVKRRAEIANHELQVTGRFGVPASGVSAVLLNVTAVDAPRSGFISIIPKPPRVGNVFDDQASFGAFPSTSNLNVDGPAATPNMVLARVGAGGKIRFHNPYGPTHVIADIAGWFGTDGRHDDGAGFEGVVPRRLMDSRIGVGGPARRFTANETRWIKVAGVAGVPANAESVVLNITTDAPGGIGNYVTAFPKGEPVPNASNVNGRVNGARANLAVVKVGDGGYIGVRSSVTSTNMIVDVFGSFGPYGEAITAIDPVRAVDSRSGYATAGRPLGPGETRTLNLRGRVGVPSDATAVVINLTSTGSTTGGYFTAFPSDAARPTVSSVNFEPHQNVPNLVMIKLGPDGSIKLYNDRGHADVIVDVMGFVS